MNKLTLFEKLQSTGLPVSYHSFPEGYAPPLPFIVYLETDNDDFIADNQNYAQAVNYQVELYSALVDSASEAAIEGLFKDSRVVYQKYRSRIETESVWQTVYTIWLLGE